MCIVLVFFHYFLLFRPTRYEQPLKYDGHLYEEKSSLNRCVLLKLFPHLQSSLHVELYWRLTLYVVHGLTDSPHFSRSKNSPTLLSFCLYQRINRSRLVIILLCSQIHHAWYHVLVEILYISQTHICEYNIS